MYRTNLKTDSSRWLEDRWVSSGDSDEVLRDGSIEVVSLRVPTSKRKNGAARSAMNFLIKQADEEGRSIVLLASPLDAKTSVIKLISFYESLGFEKTGKVGNMAGDPIMIRAPKI